MYIVLMHHKTDTILNRYWVRCDTKEEAETTARNYERDGYYRCLIVKAEFI